MKRHYLLQLVAIFWTLSISGQNPNWTLPGQYYQPGVNIFNLPTDINGYQGDPSTRTHGAYTGPDGEVLFFTVDEYVYNKEGVLAGELSVGSELKGGYSEKLILPLGNDCRRFAIIYSSAANSQDIFVQPLGRQNLYMAIYDLDLPNPFSPGSDGTLVEIVSNTTLADISKRDGELYGSSTNPIYAYTGVNTRLGYSTAYHIAATELIDNCYYRVYVSDGLNLISYKLTSTDLEYQGVVTSLWGEVSNSVRSEMELIKLDASTYRIAIPAVDFGISNPNGYSILIYDIHASTGNIVSGSFQQVPLYQDAQNVAAEPIGLEFNEDGRYLYFTHTSNLDLPNTLDVWDVQNAQFVTPIPSLAGISLFRQSYIERFGSNLYLASGNTLGLLSDINTPLLLSLNSNFQSITSGYGNDAGTGSNFYFRYILPDQLDMPYPALTSMSCACCNAWSGDVATYTADESDTWTPLNNPFNGGTGATVTINEELRIPKGIAITIEDMVFQFGPNARVIIERGDETSSGGYLALDETRFTATADCENEEFESCGFTPEDDCERRYWEGIIVEGHVGTTQAWTSTTKQGRVQIANSSIVEFARTAVMAGDIDDADYAGGIVRVTNSLIKDNIIGLRFMPFLQYNSSSVEVYTLNRISHNEFITTTDFITTDAELPNKFIWVAGNSGVNILGNVFENQAILLFADIDRGTGVYSDDSRTTVSWLCSGGWALDCTDGTIIQNEFRNLAKGVDAFTSASSRQTRVEYSIFDNNIIGTQIAGQTNARILDNEFYIPRAVNNVGLYLLGSSGYAVENNFFRHVTGSGYPWSFGIAIESSGAAVNEIYRNKFQNIRIGIVSQGVNANSSNFDVGLRYLCNNFIENIRWSDIYLNTGSLSDDQGFCLPPDVTSPAGNIFSHSSSTWSDHYDFRVNETYVDPSTLEISYRHHTPDATPYQQRLIPLQYTGHIITEDDYVQPFMCNLAYSEESCPVKRSSFNTPVEVGPKSNSEIADLSTEEIFAAGTIIEDEIDQHLSVLDGGNTLALLNGIANNESPESISAMLDEAGEMVSKTVLQSLNYSGNLAYSALANTSISSLTGIESVSDELTFADITLPSEDVEVAWKVANMEKENFWTSVTERFQRDTLFDANAETILTMLGIFQPEGQQRFASALAIQSGLSSPEWIRDENKLDGPTSANFVAADNSFPIYLSTDALASFSNAADIAAINASYTEAGMSYYYWFDAPFDADSDENKQNNNEQINDFGKVASVYPNPFSAELIFRFNAESPEFTALRIELFDLLGRRVDSRQFTTGSIVTIDGLHLPKGMLTYTIFLDGTPVQNGKVVRVQ